MNGIAALSMNNCHLLARSPTEMHQTVRFTIVTVAHVSDHTGGTFVRYGVVDSFVVVD